jgi:dephospho-CoA kinase
MHDAEKRARAHFVIDTGQGFDHAREQVRAVMAALRTGDWRKPESPA